MWTKLLIAAALGLAPATPLLAQDAMAGDAMAQDGMASDAMAPMMSDDDLALCLEQAAAITFAQVASAAEHACHALHNGEPMAGDAMAGDARAGDAMAGDAMAPQQ